MCSETATDHFRHPPNVGLLADATATGRQVTTGLVPHRLLCLRIKSGSTLHNSAEGCYKGNSHFTVPI